MSGKRIIDGLRDALAGNIARVTIEGVTWVRSNTLSPEERRLRQKAAARKYIQGEKGKLRRKLRRGGLKGATLDEAIGVAFPDVSNHE